MRHQITSQREKWRFVCPRSADHPNRQHTNWFPLDGIFRCQSCQKDRTVDPSIDPDYEYLVDQKTGQKVPREEIELAIDRPWRNASADD